MVHVLLKPGLENFEHYFTSVWDESNCAVVWAFLSFPGGSEVKAFASNVEDPGSIPGSGRSPGEGNGNPLQYEWSSSFPYFLQFKSEFGSRELVIWATVSSRSCFCGLYRASPSLATKNIINLISVLTIWWCPCVESSHVVGRVCLLWPVHFLGKTLLPLYQIYRVL